MNTEGVDRVGPVGTYFFSEGSPDVVFFCTHTKSLCLCMLYGVLRVGYMNNVASCYTSVLDWGGAKP